MYRIEAWFAVMEMGISVAAFVSLKLLLQDDVQ